MRGKRTICKKWNVRRDGKVIDSHITSDWLDYIRMAEKLGLQLELDIVRFPLDLKRRHNELASQVKEQQAMARASQRKAAIEARAQALEEKFSIKKIMGKAKKLYEYAGDTFCICVPEGAADIISDGEFLDHCVPRSDRYYERISERESYTLTVGNGGLKLAIQNTVETGLTASPHTRKQGWSRRSWRRRRKRGGLWCCRAMWRIRCM